MKGIFDWIATRAEDPIRVARKLVVTVIGGTVLLIGLIMMVTPGPGTPVIIIGLAILATEFVWAARLLKKVKEKAVEVTRVIRKQVGK